MKKIWETKNFFGNDIHEELKDFLNKEEIQEFKILDIGDTHIYIIYKIVKVVKSKIYGNC